MRNPKQSIPESIRGRRAENRVSFALMDDVTRFLEAIEQGEPKAAAELLPLVYDELRLLAAERWRRKRLDTALVHEAYLRPALL